jgi:hypothetical protein
MTNLELIEYYSQLLILQYRTQEKAPEHIKALIKILMIFELLVDIENGFSIDTAIGHQQDILAKYLGVDRTIKGIAFTRDYWGYCEYGDTSPFVFFPYCKYGEIAPDVQMRSYKESSQSLYELTDEEFRFVMKMKIIQNNSNHSAKEIDEMIYRYFPDKALFSDFVDRGNMSITYIFNEASERMVGILASEKLLPKPAGVAVTISFVPDINHLFGYSAYSGVYPDFIYGYIKYGDVPQGGWLKYGTTI